MKVLFVSPYPPAPDGIGAYTQGLVTELRASGHDSRVLVPRGQEHQASDVLGVLGAALPDLDLVLAWSPDVMHVQFAVAAFGTRTRALFTWLQLIRRATSAPLIATMHEVTRDTALLHGPGRALYRRLAARCDHVIVHTEGARSALVEKMGVPRTKVSVIPHPRSRPPQEASSVTGLRARFGLGEAELLLAFGFVHVDKGLDDLVRALGIIRTSTDLLSRDQVRLVIAGTVRPRHGLFRVFEWRDRRYLARVLRMIRRGGLSDIVVRTGYVPEADVAAWFQASAAVMLPYRRTEQSGVAGLAGAFGTPVLASTVGGLEEQYGSSKWTFPPRSPQDLADVISRFLGASPAERAATTGESTAAGIESVVGATLAVYELATMPEAVLAGAGVAVGSSPDAS